MLVILIFLYSATINSALFTRIVIANGVIEVFDKMPQWLIKTPRHQIIAISEIKEVFWSAYDMKASKRTSRMRVHKNSKNFDYVNSKYPRAKKFLVFKFKKGPNAYIRYFTCLSISDRKEILRNVRKNNKKALFRIGDFEKWGRAQ